MRNIVGVIHGRLDRVAIKETLIHAEDKGVRMMMAGLLQNCPDRGGYVIALPLCHREVVWTERSIHDSCRGCQDFDGVDKCDWCGW